MIFTSFPFLLFFASLLLLMVFVRNTRPRIYLLLFASYFFYAMWSVKFVLLIFACSLWSWIFGLLIHNSNNRLHRRAYLIASISLCLGTLGFFKYTNFILENVTGLFDIGFPQHMDIVLPVGISFFLFQAMSYTIDLYRGKIDVSKNLTKFLLFVAFFPQLVAGPIVRASEFLPQLENKIKLNGMNFIIGAQIFLGGALQKVLIADNLSVYVDVVFREPSLYSVATLWFSLLCYSIQIFCDFSGYSLMAIGLARILGFQLPENFRMPYLSKSVTEFWRRWHITLSTWLRDYLYISLGGNRKGINRTYVNLMITMLLGGLWHGASWNFLIWGGMHGLALIVHRLWERGILIRISNRTSSSISAFSAWSITFVFVLLTWVPFRCQDLSTTLIYFKGLFFGSGEVVWFHTPSIVVMLGVIIWHMLYRNKRRVLALFPTDKPLRVPAFAVICCLVMMLMIFSPVNTSPFIYFQF